jgi:SIR2-like domain
MIRSVLRDELADHLRAVGAAPFLFVGSGVSKRYLGLPNWEQLLEHFAGVLGKDYAYYRATAAADNAKIASLIAADLHDRWWNTNEFDGTKAFFADIHPNWANKESALKAEVAEMVASGSIFRTDDPLKTRELELLERAKIDGIITTNYDPLLEQVFPDFKAFVGEDELLFSNTQGVGEIYKIHGSWEQPDSLVLTSADYERFNERKPYLAAKLLTIFVERPVVFLGYGLGDENILEIIRSIAAALDSRERIEELSNRLVFVEYSPEPVDDPRLGTAPIPVGGGSVLVKHVRVHDFPEVFEALTMVERKFSARLLRHLRERVFELVQGEDPHGRVVVVGMDDKNIDLDNVEFVIGVGVAADYQEDYRGKDRTDLLYDVLDNGELVPRLVVEQTLPTIDIKAAAPSYKYLRALDLLDDDGNLIEPNGVDPTIAKRVASGVDAFHPKGQWLMPRGKKMAEDAGDFETLLANEDADAVLTALTHIPPENHDPERLRQFLIEIRGSHFENPRNATLKTHWGKCVAFYDWLVYAKSPGKASQG